MSSGFAKPLVGAAVLLTGVATLGAALLPTLARRADGTPFVEVQPAEVEPEGAPSGLAFTAPDPTVPPDPFADPESETEEESDPEAPPEAEPEAEEGDDAPLEEEPALDLSDIPAYPVPAGFEVLETWDDGDFMRGTIYAATNGDEAALLAYLGAGHTDRRGSTNA